MEYFEAVSKVLVSKYCGLHFMSSSEEEEEIYVDKSFQWLGEKQGSRNL